jgi:hypothetical protein
MFRPTTVLRVIFVIIGVALGIYLITLNLPRVATKAIFVGGAVVLSLVYTGINSVVQRRRTDAIKANLSGRGFVLNSAEDKPPEILHYSPESGHQDFSPEFSALGVVGQHPAHVAEYTFEIAENKSSRSFRVSSEQSIRVLEVAIDHPGAFPEFILRPHVSLAHRPLSELFSSSGSSLGDQRFAKRWDVECADLQFAESFLTPALQSWLASAPSQEKVWRLRNGWISCSWHKTCYSDDLDPMLERVRTFVELAGTPAASAIA